MRNLLYIWSRYGDAAAASSLYRHGQRNRPPGKPPADFPLIVRAKLQYVGSVKGWNNPVYKALAARLQALDRTFVPTTRIVTHPTPTTFEVFAEGKTDHAHLASALTHFQHARRFTELAFIHNKTKDGDEELIKTCTSLAAVHHSRPIVFVFDRDKDDVIRRVTEPGKMFKDWGNNVFSLPSESTAAIDRETHLH